MNVLAFTFQCVGGTFGRGIEYSSPADAAFVARKMRMNLEVVIQRGVFQVPGSDTEPDLPLPVAPAAPLEVRLITATPSEGSAPVEITLDTSHQVGAFTVDLGAMVWKRTRRARWCRFADEIAREIEVRIEEAARLVATRQPA